MACYCMRGLLFSVENQIKAKGLNQAVAGCAVSCLSLALCFSCGVSFCFSLDVVFCWVWLLHKHTHFLVFISMASDIIFWFLCFLLLFSFASSMMDIPLVPPLNWMHTFLSVGRSKGRDCILSKTSLLVKCLFVNGQIVFLWVWFILELNAFTFKSLLTIFFILNYGRYIY